MSGAFDPALFARAAAAPGAAGALAVALLMVGAFGPVPHAARALLRLALPGARARAWTPAALTGLRAGLVLGVAGAWALAGGPGALVAALAGLAGLLALADLRWRWLPVEWTAALGASGLALALAAGDGARAALDGAAMAAALLAVQAGFRALRGREGLGTGDVVLAAGIAVHLGLGAGALLLFAAAAGALAAEAVRLRGRPATMRPERTVPLGAWLAICFACAPAAAMLG
ncbi:MAG: prepilin peptidase [Pseudomonadota bacterium]